MGDFEQDLEESRKAAKAVLTAMKAEADAWKSFEEALGKLYSKALEYYQAHRNHMDPAELDRFTKTEQEAESKAAAAYQAAKQATRDAVDVFVKAEKHVVSHMARLGLPWPH